MRPPAYRNRTLTRKIPIEFREELPFGKANELQRTVIPSGYWTKGPSKVRRTSDGKIFNVIGCCYEEDVKGFEITVEEGVGNWVFLNSQEYEEV